MHYVLVNRLGLSLPMKTVVLLTDRHDMTISVDFDVKLQNNKQQLNIIIFSL